MACGTRTRVWYITVMKRIAPFLMFSGEQRNKAEEAIGLYVSLFANSEILSIERYGPGEIEPEGTVKLLRFTLNGTELMAIESALDHRFTFTPSISLYVECESEEEVDVTFGKLAEGGMALMPIDNYGFSTRFGWVQDRYGVSWQLNLP